MVQDKFLDSFIEDIYAIEEQENNVFWFRGKEGETNHIKTNKTIAYLGYDKIAIKNKLQSIKSTDAIFVHWYDSWISELVIDLPNKLFVVFWGGELYEEPFWHHAKWIYDAETYSIVEKKMYPKISISRDLKKTLKSIIYLYQFPKIIKKQYSDKLKQVQRIDYIICGKLNSAEVAKVKALYPTFRAKHLAGQYDLNFDIANGILVKPLKSNSLKVLVGNSATEPNNHLEAFKKLKNIKNIEVYCPLSYGSDYYREIVIAEGIKVFGKRFHPVIDFMKRNEYVGFINEMDVVFMYHNRSQAWGNIATSLTLGKPVFLKEGNAIKQYISAIGIETYNADLIGQYDLEAVILQEQQNLKITVEKLNKTISKEVRLNNLKEIMTDYAV
jgi:hypothetical protein